MNNNQVLIVGGGPSGMLLALELALFGIRSRIISKHQRSSPHSKATIIWPGVLEVLERTGVTERLIDEAHFFDKMNYYSNKKLVGNIRFDQLKYTAYPFAITIPQWKTEKILEETLNNQGIYIEYGYEFYNGHCVGDEVETLIRDPAGKIAKERYRWLIGADGFSSQVRSVFGFQFNGFSMRTKLAITDTEIVGEATSNEVGYYLHKTGNMVLAPLGNGIFRVGASVPEGYEGEIDRAFFNHLLKTRVSGEKKLGDMLFCGQFNTHVRSVDTLRKGSVFLVGDAAHAMSPSGAQGLNCGFHDVINLGWKLAGVMHHQFDDSILNSYSEERLEGIKQITKVSTFLTNISLYKSYPAILMRDTLFRLASKTNLINKYFSPRISQLNIPLDGTLNNKYELKVGKRIPLQWIKTLSAPAISRHRFTFLFWPGNNYAYKEWKLFQESIHQKISRCCCIDLAGKVLGPLRNLLSKTPIYIIVRPDGYIFACNRIDHKAYDQTIYQAQQFLL